MLNPETAHLKLKAQKITGSIYHCIYSTLSIITEFYFLIFFSGVFSCNECLRVRCRAIYSCLEIKCRTWTYLSGTPYCATSVTRSTKTPGSSPASIASAPNVYGIGMSKVTWLVRRAGEFKATCREKKSSKIYCSEKMHNWFIARFIFVLPAKQSDTKGSLCPVSVCLFIRLCVWCYMM